MKLSGFPYERASGLLLGDLGAGVRADLAVLALRLDTDASAGFLFDLLSAAFSIPKISAGCWGAELGHVGEELRTP
jgi:hypothetical protein